MPDSFSRTHPSQSGSTRPSKPGKAGHPSPAAPAAPPKGIRARLPGARILVAWGLAAVLLFSVAAYIGAVSGYRSAMQNRQAQRNFEQIKAVVEQYQWGLQDQQAGRYAIAKQRYEWVLGQDPNFPDADQRLAEVNAILYVTATPTPTPLPTSTPTPSPTPDLRPIQDLFDTAQSRLSAGDWDGVINAVINLRSADPGYEVARVDRTLYIALRNRGVDKILQQGDLGGGSYDLALAEQFGPLDAEANYARGWARLYEYGSAFWGADPAAAVYYFGQLAAAAPYLSDGTGWTAMARYRAVLIQYGDKLASQGDWCAAEEQYRLATNINSDADLQAAAENAYLECHPPTATPTPEPTFTLTPTLTNTEIPPPTWTASPTTQVAPPPTETATLPPPTTEAPPAPSETPTQPPAQDPTATATPAPSETSELAETPSLTPTSTASESPADSQLTETLKPRPTRSKP